MKLRKTAILFLSVIIISALLLSACSSSGGKYDMEVAPGSPSNSVSGGVDSDVVGSSENSIIVTTTDRMIVYYVYISLETPELFKTADELQNKAKELGGYTQESTQNNNYCRCYFRIPTEKLNDFVNAVSASGNVYDKSVRSEDITELYTNAVAEKSTLEARKAALERMLEREGITLEEEITISKELSIVDGRLNLYEKEINEYKKKSEFSSVSVSIYSEGRIEEDEPTFWEKLGNTLDGSGKSVGKVFGALLIAFVAMLPYIGIIGGIFGIYVLIKYLICKKKNIPFRVFKKRNRKGRGLSRKEKGIEKTDETEVSEVTESGSEQKDN